MQLIFTKKRVLFGAIFLLLTVLALVLSTYGSVTIEAPINDESQRIDAEINSESFSRELVITNPKNKLFLKSGTYFFKFRDGSKETGYQIKIGRFLRSKNLHLKFEGQKETESLGQSSRDCALNPNEKRHTFYFRCDDIADETIAFDGEGTSRVFDAAASDDELVNQKKVITPYVGGLLGIVENGAELTAQQLEIDKISFNEGSRITVEKNSDISEYNLKTDLRNPANKLLVIYNNKNESFYIFKDLSDKEPKVLPLPVDSASNEFELRYELVGEQIFMFYGLPDDYGTSEEKKPSSNIKGPQKYIVLNAVTGKLERAVEFSKEFRLNNLFISAGGKALLVGENNRNNSYAIYSVEADRLKSLKMLDDSAYKITWEDNNSFYYASQEKIYRYSMTENASYLVYENPGSSISNLSSIYGSVYFSLFKDLSDDIHHYRIMKSDLVGARPDALLPIRSDSIHSIDSAIAYKDSIYIKTLGDSTTSVKDNILEYLKSLGIDLNKYQIKFTN